MFIGFGTNFEMKTIEDYHDLYLKCDIFLSADIFEKYRNNSLKNCELCPGLYLSAPTLSWDAIFTITKIKLDLISDHYMYNFFEKDMRGKVSYISNRYSKANNEHLKSYDPKQESKHIIYLDANNLYGYVISKFLSTSGFKWIDPEEFDLNKYTSNSLKGCALKIDHEYPKELRELHYDYPLAPVKIGIKRRNVVRLPIKDCRSL